MFAQAPWQHLNENFYPASAVHTPLTIYYTIEETEYEWKLFVVRISNFFKTKMLI